MKITKWVDFGCEVDIEISAEDVRSALSEAFSEVTQDRLGEEGPSRHDVYRAINSISTFFNGLTDNHIALLSPASRDLCAEFLQKQSERFRP